MQELGIQTIAAYSPEARGRSERNFGTWQNRLPQELRLAGISTLEEANRFLREKYIAEFNEKFSVAARSEGRRSGHAAGGTWTSSSRCRPSGWWTRTTQWRSAAAGGRSTSRAWRYSLAKQTVTIHQHLDGTVSIRFGPHVVGRYDAEGGQLATKTQQSAVEKAGAWKPAKTKCRFSPAPTLPWKSRRRREIPTFPPRRQRLVPLQSKSQNQNPKGGGLTAAAL